MKREILALFMMLAISGLFTMQSCNKETPTPFKTYGSFTDPVLLAPADGGFVNVTGTTVELKWESTDSDGDPQKWDVYFGEASNPELYQSGVTQQTVTVEVTPGTEYFWRVQITDAHKVITRSPTWSFQIVDPAAPLEMEMTWETNSLAAIGMEIDPIVAANMRLRIYKEDKKTMAIPASINTAGFESYSGFNTLADGIYWIETEVAATIDAGDFNNPLNISIELAFNQTGTMSETFGYPEVMTNEFVCTTYKVYLGYVTKVGNTYTFTKEVTKPVSPLSFVWYGLDNSGFEYPSQVETYQGCALMVKGLSYDWMLDYWGEVIIKGGYSTIAIDTVAGTVTIPNQFYCRTKYNGAVQPDYFIEGTGTIARNGGFWEMTISYDLLQNGVSMASMDPLSDPIFVATLTTDPAAAKGATKSVRQFTRPLVKPAQRK